MPFARQRSESNASPQETYLLLQDQGLSDNAGGSSRFYNETSDNRAGNPNLLIQQPASKEDLRGKAHKQPDLRAHKTRSPAFFARKPGAKVRHHFLQRERLDP